MKLVFNRTDAPRSEILISIVTGLAFYAKQFYLTESGSLQIGDIILMIAVFFVLMLRGLSLYEIDVPFAIFILSTIVINTIYYSVYSDFRFVLSILFMLFNGIAVIFLFRPMLHSDFFLKSICISCKLVLISQLVFLVTGFGKWMYLGTRYIGTFNDPNQYGFYIITCFFCVFLTSAIRNEKMHFFWVVLTALEILPSASTGMIGTFVIFGIGYIIGLNSTDKKRTSNREKTAIALFLIGIVFVAVFYKQIIMLLSNINLFGISRITQRLLGGSSYGGIGFEFLEDRGLMRLIEMPHYFLFGSGEGGWLRFKSVYNEGYELHSTVLGLAYYYGIVPFSILVYWVRKNTAKLSPSVIFVYIALLLEALTLINHRQQIFWFIIVIASHEALKRQQESDTLR